MLRAVRECQDSRVVKRMSMGCQEGVKSCEEGVKGCEEGVKSCEEGGMRVTVSKGCPKVVKILPSGRQAHVKKVPRSTLSLNTLSSLS